MINQDSEAVSSHRPSLRKCIMDTAYIFAKRSTCSRLQVGAVITNAEMTSIDAIGYNGGAKGLANECESPEAGRCGHIHAEINCLIKANYNRKDKKMFVTCSPCVMCAKDMINGNISEVYFAELYRDATALTLFFRSGIKVFQVNLAEDTLLQLVDIDNKGTSLKWKSA